METRTIRADYNKVLKASINVLQDLHYTIDALDGSLGLIVASRLTEAKQADLAREPKEEDDIPTWQKVLGIGLIIVIVGGIILLLTGGGDDDDDDEENVSHHHFREDSDAQRKSKVFQYKMTINLEQLDDKETNIRVSVQGQTLVGGKVVKAGPIHEPEFFQKFFASLDKALFLEN